uniref:Major facilitator superfamily (MFS) profile domain-containing protein n=1 Tax=Anopheles minimus TaxID=112268 RepID=A0A182VUX8_9DIPT
MSTGIAGWITCRQVLNIMVIFGFMLNYALRVNFTIAIVAMTKTLVSVTTGGDDSTGTNVTDTTMADLSTTTESSVIDEADKFEWDARQQNLMLGSFFWGYVLTELPGGRLAEIIGGRRVFGYSMLWASLLTLLTPLASNTHYIAVVVLRAVLGFFLGASWPAIHPLTAVWIPPMDRSKFIANMMASSLGAAITMPICGFLIATIGWQSVFYFTGGLGLLWSIVWFLVVFESPATHPRITPEERNEIESAIDAVGKKKKPSYVPWKSIITSPPVWAIILTHGASVFGFFTVVNQLPTYMKYILHFNIKENGLLSSLPYFGKYAMAVISSHLADYLRKSGKLSTTATRKIFTAFAVMTPGFLMIIQVYMGETRSWAVGIFTLSLFLNGAVTAGYLGNGLDIAPNFSGTIFGMANTLSSFGGFVSAYMVGVLTNDNQTYGQWQIVFWILAVIYITGSTAYVIMGTGELQAWNNPPEKGDGNGETEEGVPLNQRNQAAVNIIGPKQVHTERTNEASKKVEQENFALHFVHTSPHWVQRTDATQSNAHIGAVEHSRSSTRATR